MVYNEDQQNGFRKHKFCEDHIFVLTSIIKNRMSEGRDTFCAFIDMQNYPLIGLIMIEIFTGVLKHYITVILLVLG